MNKFASVFALLITAHMAAACNKLADCPKGTERRFCKIVLYVAPPKDLGVANDNDCYTKDIGVTMCVPIEVGKNAEEEMWHSSIVSVKQYIAKTYPQKIQDFRIKGGVWATLGEPGCIKAEVNPWEGTSTVNLDLKAFDVDVTLEIQDGTDKAPPLEPQDDSGPVDVCGDCVRDKCADLESSDAVSQCAFAGCAEACEILIPEPMMCADPTNVVMSCYSAGTLCKNDSECCDGLYCYANGICE